ncbi:MAG: UDP-2,3-diacylglucosamine diphosphatase LpxI [Rhodospirillales bacterium]
MRRIGLIAGGGRLPVRIVDACRKAGHQVVTVAIENHADDILPQADLVVRMGAAGRIIDFFREAGVDELVMAGPVRRPSLAEIRPDGWGARFLFRSGAAMLGDDGLLSAISKELEKEGFRVIGADELLGDALAGEGLIAGEEPDSAARADITRGIGVLAAIAPVDVGQAVVVQSGLVLGVEAVEGTDELIRRTAGLRRDGPPPVLVKAPKPQQDRRLDLPTVGATTVRALVAHGFAGLAIEAGGVMLMERDEVMREIEQNGMFLYAFPPPAET